VNYTLATENNPDVFAASTNCQNSMVMDENYNLDRILQDEFDELAQIRVEVQQYRDEIEFAEDQRRSTRFFQPPEPPPPPPPSPPPPGAPQTEVALAPPAPPTQVTFDLYIRQLYDEIGRREARERALLVDIEGCLSFGGSRTHVCGLSSIEGPNPWISKSGAPCRGNFTKSARFGDFCSFWDSNYNVDAAPADEKSELIKAGPWCFADELGDEVLECDGRAQRTQRAGVFEIAVIIHRAHARTHTRTHTKPTPQCALADTPTFVPLFGSIGSGPIEKCANSNSSGRGSLRPGSLLSRPKHVVKRSQSGIRRATKNAVRKRRSEAGFPPHPSPPPALPTRSLTLFAIFCPNQTCATPFALLARRGPPRT